MKNFIKIPLAILCLCMMTSCSDDNDSEPEVPKKPKPPTSSWKLEWQDNFDSGTLDENSWSRITQGTPDWQKYQSTDDRCYEFRDGLLVLKGIVNDDFNADPRPYLCGGIWTKGKRSLSPGYIAVRARMPKGANGAWPAIWLMPFSPQTGWPDCGEIDIMERLNHDNLVYQTVHCASPSAPNGTTKSLDPSEWHTYEVYILPDRIQFRIDNYTTGEYLRQDNGGTAQYPFYTDWDLRIDMQLGGSWVEGEGGPIAPEQLPVEMEVDWVKHYVFR